METHLTKIVERIREMLPDIPIHEFGREYHSLNYVHSFESEFAAIEVQHDRRENNIMIHLRKAGTTKNEKYYLKLDENGRPIRNHLWLLAIANQWVAFERPAKKRPRPDKGAIIERDIDILSKNMEAILNGDWMLVLDMAPPS